MLHQIGVGVLGPVYRTYDPERDRLVAVKVFRLDIPPEQARAFADELQRIAALGLADPGHVALLAADIEGTIAYLAQEYVAAESLDVAMRHYAPATLERAASFITQLGGALDGARAAGVLHGSLHPRDVFVTPDSARATGFGIVAALEGIGLRGPVRRPYTAPERIAGQNWGPPADIFSLAAIAYELITSKRPTGTGADAANMLRDLGGADTAALKQLFGAALAETPGARPATGQEFASALQSMARGSTVIGFASAIVRSTEPTPPRVSADEPVDPVSAEADDAPPDETSAQEVSDTAEVDLMAAAADHDVAPSDAEVRAGPAEDEPIIAPIDGVPMDVGAEAWDVERQEPASWKDEAGRVDAKSGETTIERVTRPVESRPSKQVEETPVETLDAVREVTPPVVEDQASAVPMTPARGDSSAATDAESRNTDWPAEGLDDELSTWLSEVDLSDGQRPIRQPEPDEVERILGAPEANESVALPEPTRPEPDRPPDPPRPVPSRTLFGTPSNADDVHVPVEAPPEVPAESTGRSAARLSRSMEDWLPEDSTPEVPSVVADEPAPGEHERADHDQDDARRVDAAAR